MFLSGRSHRRRFLARAGIGAGTDGQAACQPFSVAVAHGSGLADPSAAPPAASARCSYRVTDRQRVGFSRHVRFRESVPECHPCEGFRFAFAFAFADAIGGPERHPWPAQLRVPFARAIAFHR